MAKNTTLNVAKSTKNDEFYTRYYDIEKEMGYYKDFFKGKVVYCNCDDARESNFFKFFSYNFEHLGLKKLICTGYKADGKGVVLTYEGDKNGNRKVDDEEIVVRELNGNGDFRSEECIEYLKECDVVVTNPPFSLFREYYIPQLIEYGKYFIVMGNTNAISYKEIFPLIKEGKIWFGRTLFTGKMPFFKVSDDYALTNERYERKEDGLYKQVNSICWFTNVPNDAEREIKELFKKYSPNEYVKYDNYDAIECGEKGSNGKYRGNIDILPKDYDGKIGVPITSLIHLFSDGFIHFLIDGKDTKFEIVGLDRYVEDNPHYGHRFTIDTKECFARILIKKQISV